MDGKQSENIYLCSQIPGKWNLKPKYENFKFFQTREIKYLMTFWREHKIIFEGLANFH